MNAKGDIHPSVWHVGAGSVAPASYLPTHICLSERCWKLCPPSVCAEEKAGVCAGNLRELGQPCDLETWKASPTTDANESEGFKLKKKKTISVDDGKYFSLNTAARALWRLDVLLEESLSSVCFEYIVMLIWTEAALRDICFKTYKRRENILWALPEHIGDS